MEKADIDLKKAQQDSLARRRYQYSRLARIFFGMMDLVTGKEVTLPKAKLIETLASIPYRAWENRHYARMTRHYRNLEKVNQARQMVAWCREAQDNEFWHLLIIEEKMKEDGIKDPWYLYWPIPSLMVASYVLLAKIMVLLFPRRAYRFNAEFEDHAEHVYAQFVADHPEWEEQPVKSALVKEYGQFDNWADVFRRIGLDERDHMNRSFVFSGRPDHVVKYNGMPEA
ncbi:MAG: alternative oxidase [Desulfobacteraceae bacterium]